MSQKSSYEELWDKQAPGRVHKPEAAKPAPKPAPKPAAKKAPAAAGGSSCDKFLACCKDIVAKVPAAKELTFRTTHATVIRAPICV